ncbi:hypothetical protein WJX73_005943 [Symbiochloris irregularis]|uniref:Lariat debranching enzyme C-terminal domain-containing protein n=1 Tax=Symbiochloris irregularis TaxID=706552 RepID=A0AAW1P1R3_9CHLO
MVSPAELKGSGGLRIAVEGCCHGELDNIYSTMQLLEKRQGTKIDLLICCGDFQAVRNLDDLECLACPVKYRSLNTFHKYHSGQLKAPYPTIFIGGNHEASNYLWELYYGGWVAPNIYYLGHAGVVNFAGIRIGGLSGIFNDAHYSMGHWEAPPYQGGALRSAYHIRALEVYRLMQLKKPLDVFLSHDWPQGVAHHGDKNQLLRAKPFLKTEVGNDSLGSPPARMLMDELQPSYWFSAHLHVKYAALVQHSPRATPASTAASAQQPQVESLVQATRFLALDKCLPKRRFLQVVHFPDAHGAHELSYDAEWLAILRGTHGLLSLQRRQYPPIPGMVGGRPKREGPAQGDLEYVQAQLAARGGEVPHNFTPTAVSQGELGRSHGVMPRSCAQNPQTLALLDVIGRPFNLAGSAPSQAQAHDHVSVANPEEIALDDTVGDDEDADGDAQPAANGGNAAVLAPHPEDIDIGNEDEDEADDE